MRVNVLGFGMVNFPDSMEEKEIKAVLKQFEKPKKDDTKDILKAVQRLLDTSRPNVVEIEKQVIIEKPVIQKVEVEKVIEKPVIKEIGKDRGSWEFTIERNSTGISKIIAEPINGG